MYGKGLLKGLWVTFKKFFQKDITIQYPDEMPFLQKRYRGCLVFEFEKCIVCGICEKVCPNNVLHLDTIQPENSKKKKLMHYTIDLQYCLFCNICVENCPGKCLSFSHNFELSAFKREDIKIVYDRPVAMDIVKETAPVDKALVENETDTDDKKQKKIVAMMTALTKNPIKALSKLLDEDQAVIMSEMMIKDAKKAEKLAELMAEDMEKAKKIAVAFVNKELKDRQRAQQSAEGGGEA